MTDGASGKRREGPASAGPATGGSAHSDQSGAESTPSAKPSPSAKAPATPDGGHRERVVIRDRRKIDPSGGARSRWSESDRPARSGAEGSAESAGSKAGAGDTGQVRDANGAPQEDSPAEEPAGKSNEEQSGDDSAVAAPGHAEGAEPTRYDHSGSARLKPRRDPEQSPESGESTEAAVQQSTGPVTDEETGKETELDLEPEPDGGVPLGAELEALRAELDERTRDLQRVTAEYANYRKRVDRDRGLMAEQATGSVLSALLPVLDDLDRARDHGDLVGPFGAVAEQLTAALAKFGLTPFGEKGDPFDPTRHEAVAHLTSPDVTEPTCIDVMRRGYLLGDRMLRPALVAVADPESA